MGIWFPSHCVYITQHNSLFLCSVCVSLTRSFAVTLANIKGDVSKTTSIFIPASAKVNAAIKPALDEKPAWESTKGPLNVHSNACFIYAISNWNLKSAFNQSMFKFLDFCIEMNWSTGVCGLIYSLTSILGRLITVGFVCRVEGVGLDQVHLGVFSSTTEDVLAIFAWITQEES